MTGKYEDVLNWGDVFAAAEDEQEAEKVLLAFDQGSHAPGMAKGRLQHRWGLCAQRIPSVDRTDDVARLT